ncbi:MAG: HAD-IIA family hydrolase [Acidimicrobiia bacterium]|nr:HAD-IIA family hydrolase [Acidimicrobiia bacterium]
MIAWAIDLDGVVWRGTETVPGSPEAILRLREAGCPLAFVTNSALRTPRQVADKLAHHGIPGAEPEVITSAMAAASLVEPGERVVVVGADGLTAALSERGAELVASGPADAVVVGLTHDFDYDDLTRAMRALRDGARFVATNDDATFPVADQLLPGAGSIVAAVATASGAEPEVAGKPHATIAGFVRRQLGDDGIMVGDRPETDGLFARALGYRFGLVLTGVVSASDLPVQPEPDLVRPDLAALVAALSA